MESMTLKMIAQMSNGKIEKEVETVSISGVSSDSRKMGAGELFVALKGDHFDGHDFLKKAVAGGAAAAMVSRTAIEGRTKPPDGLALIFVEDTLKGLQELARNYRGMMPAQTVAVAGSNGKTGTKEMIAAVLATRFKTIKNEGNLNNHIGVPISLTRLSRAHQLGIFEVGTNHPGELRPLVKMVRPTVGVITNIGEEHLEFFRDLAGVAEEEGTLAELLPSNGMIALNTDNSWGEVMAKRAAARVVYFGLSKSAAWRAAEIKVESDGTHFQLFTPKGEREVHLSLFGRHQAVNALAAAAVGDYFGLSLDEIRMGLESLKPIKMRMERHEMANGVLVLNDAYNANPHSMRSALETAGEMPVKGRRIAALGAMLELGSASKCAHREMGAMAVLNGFDLIAVVGEEALEIAEGAKAAINQGVGKKNCRVEFFSKPQEAGDFLKKETQKGDLLLLKASRSVALEQILEAWD